MLRCLCLLIMVTIGACADSPYRTSNRQEVKGDGLSVVITRARNEAEGRPLAEDYCRAQGGAAHFRGMIRYHTRREVSKVASFDCVVETSQATGYPEADHGAGRNTQMAAGSEAVARTPR